jgi:hypothetical protein
MHPSKLHVITCITNPIRYRTRYELYKRFEKRILDTGAKFYTIEAAFGDRPHAITTGKPAHSNHTHWQLKTSDELWHKENLINIAIQRLPSDWEYVAWVDADVHFARQDWAEETVHQLQHYEVVQMWSQAHDLTPNFHTYQTHYSFAWCMLEGKKYDHQGGYYHEHWWHPGYAWAATRKAIDATGGLLDTAILGAADNHMAHAFFHMAEQTLHKDLTPGYKKAVREWEQRAKYLWKDVGYVPGLILHEYHGKKVDRKYHDRWKILVDNKFDPYVDLTRDWQGIWQLRPERIKLRDDLRAYFRARKEDSTEVG